MKKILIIIIFITYISNIISGSMADEKPATCPQGSELKEGQCIWQGTLSPVCPKGTKLIDKFCIWQGKCPAGTNPTSSAPFLCEQPNSSNAPCIPSTIRSGPYCVSNLICPSGTEMDLIKGCYLPIPNPIATCPKGSKLVIDKCIWEGGICPVGTQPSSSDPFRCVQPNSSNASCIPGTKKNLDKVCTAPIICPPGTKLDIFKGCSTIPTCPQGYELVLSTSTCTKIGDKK